jgi:hypothetical protein
MAKKRQPGLEHILPIFIQRKLVELGLAVLVILAIIFIPFVVGQAICADSFESEGYCYGMRHKGDLEYSNFDFWTAGLVPTGGGIGAFLILVLVLKEVIISNWRKAYDKAYKDLNGVEPSNYC